ncbi:MAG TPA: hypothetical protein VNZ68_02690 [Rhodocyclaceae bacterium]|nr:hypothetical protein [Rhodocyclaceae bacterium]
MSLLEACTYAIGEAVAYAAGCVVGRVFRLEPKQAQHIGEYIMITVVFGAVVLITFAYS